MNNDILSGSLQTIPSIYWVSPDSHKKQKKISKDINKTDNLVALIVSCVSKNFPELENCKESSFFNFQKQLKELLTETERRSALQKEI